MQRQFRSDDTSPWQEKFGTGSDGALSVSSNITDSSRSGFANTDFSASSGSTSATAGSGTGFSAGDLILIHQTRQGGDGAGYWELNKISSVGGGTNWTLSYLTTHAYDTKAQVYRLPQYSDITIDASKTLTAASWNNTKGGIIALLCNRTTTITGNISLNGNDGSTGDSGAGGVGIGYVGGQGFRDTIVSGAAFWGENTTGSPSRIGGDNNNRTNGGGGAITTGSNGDGSNYPGGGGGNGTVGQTAGAGTGTGSGGVGGAVVGNAGLTIAIFGGGGGGGNRQSNSVQGEGGGGAGAGLLIIITKTLIVTGGITANGGLGGTAVANAGGGGGAGGSILFKVQSATLGSSLVTATGGAGQSSGGTGGDGRIHIDHLGAITGTTNPTYDSRSDSILKTFGSSQIY